MANIVQRVLQELFYDLPFIQVYVDDLTISTKGPLTYHTACIAEVLRRLTNANLVISPEKMVLAQKNIHLLGWSIIDGALCPRIYELLSRKYSHVFLYQLMPRQNQKRNRFTSSLD